MAVQAYKFYRLNISASASNYRIWIAELYLYSFGANKAASATITAKNYWSTYYLPQNVADGATGNGWLSNAYSFPNWIQFEFAQPELIDSYAIATGTSFSGDYPTSWTLEGSNDGTNWTVVHTVSSGALAYNTTSTFTILNVAGIELPASYDVSAPSELNFATDCVYDLNAPTVLQSDRWRVVYDAVKADTVDKPIDATYDATGVTEVFARRLAIYDILPSYTSIEWSTSVDYVIAPHVGTAHLSLPAIKASARGASHASIALPALSVSSTGATGTMGSASITLPRLSVQPRAATKAAINIPAITASIDGTVGTSGSASLTLPSFIVGVASGNDGIGSAHVSLSSLGVSVSGVVGTVGAADISIRPFTVSATGKSGHTGAALVAMPPLSISGSGMASHSTAVSITLPAMKMAVSSRTADGLPAFSGWALNIENSAVTEYTGLSFNSMAVFNGIELAASSDGISTLGGDRDNTYAINAEALTSATDFDSHFMKRVRDMYIGLRADGPIVIETVTGENIIRTYPVDRVVDGIHEQRVKLRRGVKSRYWQFGVKNVDGAYFEIDRMTIEPTVLERRTA